MIRMFPIPSGASFRRKGIECLTIKELRTKYNLTQKALSDLLQIPKRTIENWEEGQRTPAEYIIRLIEFYLEHTAEEK